MVTAVVVDADQWQTAECEYNPSLCGEVRVPLDSMPSLDFGIRKFIARRAALELRPGAVVNLGIGVTDGVANIAAEEGIIDDFVFSIEMGVVGGVPAKGVIFGASWNPDCIMSMPSQFDFYHGGGLDMGFLGMGEADRLGNVQRQNWARGSPAAAVSSTSRRTRRPWSSAALSPTETWRSTSKTGVSPSSRDGSTKKFRERVEQVTFSGEYAARIGQPVLYVTERAVFKLEGGRMVLTEIAPGIDLQKDVLAQMEFVPEIAADLATMDPAIFRPEKLRVTNPALFGDFPARP